MKYARWAQRALPLRPDHAQGRLIDQVTGRGGAGLRGAEAVLLQVVGECVENAVRTALSVPGVPKRLDDPVADFDRQKKGEQAPDTAPEPPDEIAESKLWRFFLLDRDEILRHKYLRSKELGYDIGLPQAVKEWLQQHRALWAAAHPPSTE